MDSLIKAICSFCCHFPPKKRDKEKKSSMRQSDQPPSAFFYENCLNNSLLSCVISASAASSPGSWGRERNPTQSLLSVFFHSKLLAPCWEMLWLPPRTEAEMCCAGSSDGNVVPWCYFTLKKNQTSKTSKKHSWLSLLPKPAMLLQPSGEASSSPCSDWLLVPCRLDAALLLHVLFSFNPLKTLVFLWQANVPGFIEKQRAEEGKRVSFLTLRVKWCVAPRCFDLISQF